MKYKKLLTGLIAAGIFMTPLSTEAAVSTHSQLGHDIPIVAEFKDTSLVDCLDALSKLSGVPIIIHGGLQNEKITLNSDGKPLSSILDNITRAFNLSYIEQNGMIVVSKNDVMTTTETFKLKYLDLDEVAADLKTFVEDDDVSISKADNSVTISGSAADIARARTLIEAKDVKQKQVTIQARLVELNARDAKKLGLTHAWNDIHTVDSHTWSFKWTTKLLGEETEGTGKVLARPTVSTINGKEAEISIVDRVPILTTTTSDGDRTTTVEYTEVGVKLKTTPRVNEDTGYVTLDINPSVSTITGYISNENVNAPQTANREVKTSLRVRSGETIIIGGLLKQDDIMSLTKIPILGDLPILGPLLFQYKNHEKVETELVVMLTPYIEGASEFRNTEPRNHNIHNDATIERVQDLDRRGRHSDEDNYVQPKPIFDGSYDHPYVDPLK